MVQTSRLVWRRIEDSDLPLMVRLFSDPAMMHFMCDPWSEEMIQETLQEWHDEWDGDSCWYGVMMNRSTHESIGIAGFSKDTLEGESGLEMAWFVLPEHQNLGYATEFTCAMLQFGFEVLRQERVVAETHPENPGSNRVLQKLGFEKLGIRHHQYDYLPGFNDQALWAITRVDWENLKTQD